MSDLTFPECEKLPIRLRQICRGESELPEWKRYAYRERHGISNASLPPLPPPNAIELRTDRGEKRKSGKSSKKVDGIPLVLEGPGTELAAILHLLGIRMKENCGCKKMMFQMNAWGLEECQKRFDEIVKTIQDKAKDWGWGEQMTAWTSAGWNYLKHPEIWRWVSPLDPVPGLVKFAFHLWEQKQKGTSP